MTPFPPTTLSRQATFCWVRGWITCLQHQLWQQLKNIRKATLRDNELMHDPRAYILQFEKEALVHDAAMAKETQGKLTYGGIYVGVGMNHANDTYRICMIPFFSCAS